VDRVPPLHPGEILREEFLTPLQLSPYAVARAVGVPRTRIERIVREETAITADTALRLAAFFRTTAEFWLNLQSKFELETARREKGMVYQLHKIEPCKTAVVD
jgi:addiction module HigA family antidote